jgi:hypothetical protein
VSSASAPAIAGALSRARAEARRLSQRPGIANR